MIYGNFWIRAEELDGLWFAVIYEGESLEDYWDETPFFDTKEKAVEYAIEMIHEYEGDV